MKCRICVVFAVLLSCFVLHSSWASECSDAGACTLPGASGGGFATVKIQLPDNWDELMQAAGYRPLKEFYLHSTLTPAATPQQFRHYRQFRR